MTLHVVAGVIIDQQRVLVTRRSAHKADGGKWEFPGGKVETNESHSDALARELREELNIPVRVGNLIGTVDHPTKLLQLHAYHCHLMTNDLIQVGLDHDLLRWCGSAELYTLDWAPLDPPLLPAITALLQNAN